MTAMPIEKVNGHAVASPEPAFGPRALAEADAIRAEADANAAALRIKAEGEARAAEILAEQQAEQLRLENEKTQLANRRAAIRAEREEAEHANKMADLNAKREETERSARQAREQEEAEKQAATAQTAKREQTASRWMKCAVGFAIACGIVALPVQISAFWNPSAPWLAAAPVFLEGGAWVVLQGARAAVDDHRPHWHYRLIAWLLAFVAAGVNLWHGVHAFDMATAAATAFASLAGPGVWDLYEHGRIRVRDGKLTRRERKAQEKAERAAAKEKAAAEERQREEREAAKAAAAEAAQKLAERRENLFPNVWPHALMLAAALGETTVTEAVWKRAHRDIEGTDPGESVDIIRSRNVAEKRAAAARSEAPGNTPSKVTNAQRAIQVKAPRNKSSYRPTPPRRTKGDTPKFHAAARALAADAKRAANASDKVADEGGARS